MKLIRSRLRSISTRVRLWRGTENSQARSQFGYPSVIRCGLPRLAASSLKAEGYHEAIYAMVLGLVERI